MNEIQQWLINIQARAPNSPVIIVGKYIYTVWKLWNFAPNNFWQNFVKLTILVTDHSIS